MTKNVALKIATLVMLSILLISMGVTSFAINKEKEETRWSYLLSTAYDFELNSSTETKKYFYMAGSTTTGSPRNAYVKVELQRYKNGGWSTIHTISDEGYTLAGAEELNYEVAYNYTYRLKLTHQAKDQSGNVLETYTYYSYTL